MANEIVLKKDGRVVRRPVEITVPGEVELQIDDAIFSVLAQTLVRKSSRIASLHGLPVGACISSNEGDVTLSMRVTTLPLKTGYAIIAEGEKQVFVPSFASTELISIPWNPPQDMELIFAADCYPDWGSWFARTLYLFALHGLNAYQLPLPNIFADCHMCTAEEYTGRHGNTALEVFEAAFRYVCDSRWNDHIIRENVDRAANAKRLFRFEPDKNEYRTLPSENHWTTLCIPVGTDVLTRLCRGDE